MANVVGEVTFKDVEGDDIQLVAEMRDGRGRVALNHNGEFFKYISRLVFATSEKKLYVNGHEAIIPLSDDSIVGKIEQVVLAGKGSFQSAETVDAAAELEQVKKAEAEEAEFDGLTPEMIAKLQAAQEKRKAKKKRVEESAVENLISMGFPEARARRALAKCDGTSAEVALSWLEAHADDADIDDPLPEEEQPEWVKPLSAEDKKEKARELQELAKKKREQALEEEKKAAIAREKKRREEGQKLQEAKEDFEKRKRMEAYEARRREKEEDRKAREAIQAKIRADREAKGWTADTGNTTAASSSSTPAAPPQTKSSTPAAAPRAAPPSSTDDWDPMRLVKSAPTSTPVVQTVTLPSAAGLAVPGYELTDQDIVKAVERIRKDERCVGTLLQYLSNIAENPFDLKYRSIRLSNKALASRVAPVPGGLEVLLLAGFRKEPGEETIMLRNLHLPTVSGFVKALSS
eukprot:Sspe_Gene.82552::Locus_54105_Transcript_1_1_Confidence_1.000_Length_1568::g.82552::m.82552